MVRKNGNGEGSRPRERADGRWEARYWSEGKQASPPRHALQPGRAPSDEQGLRPFLVVLFFVAGVYW